MATLLSAGNRIAAITIDTDTELVYQFILERIEKLLVFSIYLLYLKHIADNFNIFYIFKFQVTMSNQSKME